MEIIKQYRDGNERHDIVCLAGETLFENWYSVLEDSCCLRHPSSTAGYFHSLDEAEAAMHKHRPLRDDLPQLHGRGISYDEERNTYTVTTRAYDKLKEQYRIRYETCLD